MKQHFLQSADWEKYQKLEGSSTFRLDTPDFSVLAILKPTPLGNYLFCPYGPTLKRDSTPEATRNSLAEALNALRALAREQQAFFVRIEPTLDLENGPLLTKDFAQLGLKKTRDLEPAHTWIIDLTQDEADILHQMRGSNVQYWRSHGKKGMQIRTSQNPEDIAILFSLLNDVASKDRFTPQDEAHLRKQVEAGFATIYLVDFEGEHLAAALAYDDADTRFYAHAATSDKERKLAAGTVLLVQMILDAKARNAKTFDFWGVTTSEDPRHPWYGFSKYKRSFGGQLATYAGTWDLPLNSLRYRLYKIVRQINRLKRKLIK